MQDKIPRGKNNCPTDRSTDGPHGPGDAAAEQSDGKATRGCAGSGSSPAGYRFPSNYKGSRLTTDTETVNDVFAAVREAHANGRPYVSPTDLDVEGCNRTDIGKALRALADDGGCPIDLERWSGDHTTPATYTVEERERHAVADGSGLECPECGHAPLDTEDENQALADDEQFEFFCNVCGELFEGESDLQRDNTANGDTLVGDGGLDVLAFSEQYHKLDRAVFPTLRRRTQAEEGALVEVRVGDPGDRQPIGIAEVLARERVRLEELSDELLVHDTGRAPRDAALYHLNGYYQNDLEPDENVYLHWCQWVDRRDDIENWQPEQAALRADETRDDGSHAQQLTQSQQTLVEGNGGDA